MSVTLGENWHNLSADDTVSLLDTNAERGLDHGEAAERLRHFGPNELTERKGRGPLMRFIMQFHQPLIYILLAATAVTLLLQEYVDAAVIFGVVLINAVIGFVQESKALQAISALQRSLAQQATVIRGGRARREPVAELVPGDIVELAAGDRVPADLRLLRVAELHTDESSLTGESLPVAKRVDVLERHTPLADRRNMAFSSTLVARGSGHGVVVATGDDSEIGRIAELVSTAEALATPLTRRIRHFSHILMIAILALAAFAFVYGVVRGEAPQDMFLAAVALAVGMIPEGLPAVVTIILAIGVSRMARRRAIVRTLPSVETLGSTTVIGSDKTGTLTQNQMTVRRIFAAGQHYEVSGVGFEPVGKVERLDAADDATPIEEGEGLRLCLLAGALCNDSELTEEEDGQWSIVGDPTEAALLTSARKAGLGESELKERLRRIDEIPFESDRQYMATLHDQGEGQPRLMFVKGSIERLLPRCVTSFRPDGESRELGRDKVLDVVEEMTGSGLRVLAFARRELPADARSVTHAMVEDGLEFLGIQGMIDPPREGVIEAVADCGAAGIKVKMLTGDHAGTAAAIARQLAIGTERDGPAPRTITGREIAEMTEDELIEAAQSTHVFARVTPEHKLRLVEALQERDEVVAVTGDGVNDAPALRRANIGVAMGRSGTEVARETADIVLTDDNFATIVAAVEEGRNVFRNLKKYIVWTLPTNGAEGLIILTGIVLGTILPLLPVQVLWVNMTTAVCLGLMLAFEPKEPDLMKVSPRRPRSALLSKPIIMRTALVSVLISSAAFALFQWELARDGDVDVARTLATTTVIVCKSFYLLNCRSLTHTIFRIGIVSNPWIWVGIGTMLTLQLGFIYLPFMNTLFHSAPIRPETWLLIVAAGVAVFVIVSFEKLITSRRMRDVW